MRKIFFYLLLAPLGMAQKLHAPGNNAFTADTAIDIDTIHKNLCNELLHHKTESEIFRAASKQTGTNYYHAATNLVNSLNIQETGNEINDVLEQYDNKQKIEMFTQPFSESFKKATENILNIRRQHLPISATVGNNEQKKDQTTNSETNSYQNSANQPLTPMQSTIAICAVGAFMLGLYLVLKNEKASPEDNFSTQKRYNVLE